MHLKIKDDTLPLHSRIQIPLERISLMVIPRPWCWTFSWKCLISSRDTWCPFGRMAGCLTWGWRAACVNLPPTLRISWLSMNGFNLCSLVDLFFCTSLLCFRDLISSLNISSWTTWIMNSLASFLSWSVVASLELVFRPLASFARRLSLAMALTALLQSENFWRRSDRDLSSFALVVWTCALLISGSSSSSSPISIPSVLGSSFCQRKLGPVNQLDSASSFEVSPREAWSAGFLS